MAAVELFVIFQQASNAPVAQAAPRATGSQGGSDGVEDQVRTTIQEVQQAAREAAQEAAKDAARSAARQGKIVHVDKDGSVTIEGRPVFTPGASTFTVPPGFDNSNLIPPQAVDIAMGFFTMCAVMVVGWPLARAFGRRLEQRGSAPAALPAGVTDQLQRIEQAVEAMSIEVERISESQRFMAKLQTQGGGQMALPHERG
jgi:hypothetical protein